jgi:hypothetical protein
MLVLLLGAVMFTARQSGVVFGLERIDDDCQFCHDVDSTVITDSNMHFESGTVWHTNHTSLAGDDCSACHVVPEDSPYVGLDPTGQSGCGNCHVTECEWEDFHEGNPTYLDNVTGDTCYDCHLECAPATTTVSTSTSSSTTTTTIPPSGCAISTLYGENSEEVEILRQHRDEVLTKTPEGRKLIRLYYQLSPMIEERMEEDPAFRKRVKRFCDLVVKSIDASEK